MSQTTTHLPTSTTDHDADYRAFERLIAERVASLRGPMFTTDATGLFDAYLAGIPGETKIELRQVEGFTAPIRYTTHFGPRAHYNCNCCRRFIEQYGGLVRIEPDGNFFPVLWDETIMPQCPKFFLDSSQSIWTRVRHAKVTGVFVNSEATWGTPFNVAGKGSKCEGQRWTHLHGLPCLSRPGYPPPENAAQQMAEKLQDYILLKRTLAEVPLEACAQAIRVLESDEVSRAEKVIGPAKWFRDLHQRLDGVPSVGGKMVGRVMENLIWLAVATAPPGFCHLKNGVLGQLMEWIKEGQDFRTMQRKWAAMMDPLAYQRPTATPSDGQIDAANKAFAAMGAESALARRYATLADVLKFEWRKNVGNCLTCGKSLVILSELHDEQIVDSCRCNVEAIKRGTFDHLRQKPVGVKAVELPPKKISWEEFHVKVLPTIRTVEVQLTGGRQPFYGLVTACDPTSRPMLQWDGLLGETLLFETEKGPEKRNPPLPRNPVSWYFYGGFGRSGSTPQEWDVVPPSFTNHGFANTGGGWWQPVSAIFLPPHQWQQPEKFSHAGFQVHFAISAARDQQDAGGGYFPETLRAEYHAVRKVIEAHAKSAKLAGKEAGDANGIALVKGGSLAVRVNGTDQYVVSL